MTPAVTTTALTKRYGKVTALADCSIAVPEGRMAALISAAAALVVGAVYVTLPKFSVREVVVDHVTQRDVPVDHVVPRGARQAAVVALDLRPGTRGQVRRQLLAPLGEVGEDEDPFAGGKHRLDDLLQPGQFAGSA